MIGGQLLQLGADPGKLIGGFREITVGSHQGQRRGAGGAQRPQSVQVSHGLLGGIDVHTGNTVKLDSYYPAYSGVLGTDGLLFIGDIAG